MRAYLAGPMTGRPQFNIPQFDFVAAALRAQGFDIVSPAELDDPATRAAALASPDGAPGTGSANGETWGDFLARDVKLLADGGIEAVIVLPEWDQSRGARLETFVASAMLGLPIVTAQVWMPSGLVVLDTVPALTLYRAWCAEPTLSIAATFGSAAL